MKGAAVSEESLEWQDRAACRSESLEVFYSEDADDIRHALALCRQCEVRTECLAHAMAHREHFGVWGGTTERERRRIFRRERRGRNRQDTNAA